MSGLELAVNGHGAGSAVCRRRYPRTRDGSALPMQYPPDVVSLTLAGDELQGVAERDEPALAAERTHLSDVVHIHDRVAVNPLELLFSEAIFDHVQGLCRLEPLFGSDDPNQLAFRLKGQNVAGV